MDLHYYQREPALRDYFNSLPPNVQQQIAAADAQISTLGELMEVAAHFDTTDNAPDVVPDPIYEAARPEGAVSPADGDDAPGQGN